MKTNYTPSINIIRDTEREINYIPTPNSQRVVGQIVDDFRKGIRAFSIIGSYGTGKSSFLLALEQSLKGVKPYFDANFLQNPNFGTVKIIGSYQSIIGTFAQQLNVVVKSHVTENIFSELFNKYHDLGKNSPLLFIVIDEFGKFLEYAAQNHPEEELYFIQQLAEFASNPKYNIVLLTTVHQSFESYSYSLSNFQRQEWIKVKGRYRDITFNEPIEQLLFLASEHINDSYGAKASKKELEASSSIFSYSKAFSFNETYIKQINNKIYPIDLLSSFVLTLSLQRYGQNERSLFSFLESTDHTSIAKFTRFDSAFFNLGNVYDYLYFNFYSLLTSKYNTDFSSWSSIRTALEEVERAFEDNLTNYAKLIKSIGLLNIFAASGSKLDKFFYTNYASTCLGITNAEELIENLVSKKILLFRKHSSRYILFEGTDLDIQSALIEAANKVSEITDVSTLLKKYFDFPPILAKEYSYLIGTPRYFEFKISETPISGEIPSDEIDGYINLVFNEQLTIKKIKEISEAEDEAIIYGFYRNSKEIKNLLYEIEKTQRVLEENKEDKVAKRELENIIIHQKILLNHYIMNNLFGDRTEVTWIWDGKEQNIDSKKAFNKKLTEICLRVYESTPVFKNEMVNKHRISSAIFTAKRNYFKALVNQWDKPDFGFEESKFPPEKTIYLSLLKENGLSTYADEYNREITIAQNSSFVRLWNFSLEFLVSAKNERKNLGEFAESLKVRPYKLKQGLIDFWIPTFLFLKRDDYALFGENGYIPNLTDEILDLLSKEPHEFTIKTFDIEGVRLDIFNSYRMFLNQETKEKISNQTFIETIKPFLIFYKNLPDYSKSTRRLTKEALAIRDAIVNSQDPERTFFEDFPIALGTSVFQLKSSRDSLNIYTQTLQTAIRELRTSFDNLIDRLEEFIKSEIVYESCDFPEYKDILQNRFKRVKKHLLIPSQKTFIQRIDSAIDDKKAWLSSISQVIIGKPLESIKDEDEIQLYDKFKTLILDLDSLTNLSKADVDEEKEEVLGLQFDSFVDGIKRSLVRLPKAKINEVDEIKESLKSVLSKDKTLNIAALAKLLKELTQK
jgi:hypothetical protein